MEREPVCGNAEQAVREIHQARERLWEQVARVIVGQRDWWTRC